ncbi:helix-turn-helix domain-containing protein [Actinomadura sp. 9N407]|uniref:helix-turn-helix domain-containing protein n=1 Tax=Actinomadura sp. 9N407 TaxID=3375154 RepID=UPI0037AEEF1A
MSPAEIRSLPVTVDLVTAGRAFGIGRTTAYQLARTGRFPCPVMQVGRSYRVRTADLLTSLGLEHSIGRRSDGQPAPHQGEH